MRTAGTLVSFSLLVIAGSAAAARLVEPLGWRRTLAAGLAVVAVGTAVVLLVATTTSDRGAWTVIAVAAAVAAIAAGRRDDDSVA